MENIVLTCIFLFPFQQPDWDHVVEATWRTTAQPTRPGRQREHRRQRTHVGVPATRRREHVPAEMVRQDEERLGPRSRKPAKDLALKVSRSFQSEETFRGNQGGLQWMRGPCEVDATTVCVIEACVFSDYRNDRSVASRNFKSVGFVARFGSFFSYFPTTFFCAHHSHRVSAKPW